MPKLLDLFCGAGGAGAGYSQAGFTVTGIDHKPQPRYPFEFHQADALDYLASHWHEYDVIHASPPCQGYSRMRHLPWLQGREWPMLIEPVRQILIQTQKPYVIENVADAPLNGAELCGLSVGLPLLRHRLFESNILLLFPSCPGHPTLYPGAANMHKRGRKKGVMGVLPGHTAEEATGIDWMNKYELRQAIPPAYTALIGKQLIQHITLETAPHA